MVYLVEKYVFFMLLFFFSTVSDSLSTPSVARVTSVIDGDTIVVSKFTNEYRIRLYGIDCPEEGQSYSQEAKDIISMLIYGEHVEIVPYSKDQFGRIVAVIKFQGININQSLIEKGAAWVYNDFCDEIFCDEWHEIMVNSRQKSNGLWKEEKPVEPWVWRNSVDEESSIVYSNKNISSKQTNNSPGNYSGKLIRYTHTRKFNGVVNKIIDGDTLIVSDDRGTTTNIELYGIDAPEANQPYGINSLEMLKNLTKDKALTIHPKHTVSHGSIKANVSVNGVSINAAMVLSGSAWVNEELCIDNDCEEWKKYQSAAIRNKDGLWRQKRPKKPWIWKQAYDKVVEREKRWHKASRDLSNYVFRKNSATGYNYHESGYDSYGNGGKTVHVDGYYRKDGTYVRPHNRRPPR